MSAAWQPEMDHLRRRVEALEKMLCQGHPAGVACGVCRPEPVPECCTDGTCPTCAPLMAWADYRKDYEPRDSAPEPDPEPVPEWREWVTAQHDEVVGSRASALEDVLMCLSEVERGASKSYALARIVARCEREVGDGWQADPSGWVATPALHALLRCVAGVPTGPGTAWPETDWQGLANAASAWLRDLTDLTEEQS